MLLHFPALALALSTGPVLRPSATRWDSVNCANPVVLPPRTDGDDWRLFYYGNDGNWAVEGVQPFIPTGRCGMATSADGLKWDAVPESTFGPGESSAWDSLH
eukprot:5581369-Prymnesium_polylepis.1